MKVFGAMILILLSAASCSAMAPPQHDRRKLQQLTENPFALDFEEAAEDFFDQFAKDNDIPDWFGVDTDTEGYEGVIEEFFKLLGPLGGASIQRWYDGPLARTSFLNGRRRLSEAHGDHSGDDKMMMNGTMIGNVTMNGTMMGNATEMANDTIAESGELAPEMADLGRKLLSSRSLQRSYAPGAWDPCRCGPCQWVTLGWSGANVCYVLDPYNCNHGTPSILRPGEKYNFC